MSSNEQFFVKSKNIPQAGNVMIHFDSHPDMLIPDKSNWILSQACEGFFSTLVWIKPPWSNYVPDGSYTLLIGKDSSGEVGICNSLPLFIRKCIYKPREKLENPKEIILEIATFGEDIENPSNSDNLSSFIERIKNRFPETGHYFLDVDLDFFSTYNPFVKMYEKANLYEQLLELYWFGVTENMTTEEIEVSVRTRMEQLTDLENLWKHVALHSLGGDPPASVLWPEVKTLATTLLSEYPQVDWELVHIAGCTWDDTSEPLVSHVTSRSDISKLINITFKKLLSSFPQKPAAITIPMLDNNYCPPEDEDYIYQELITVIESKFNINVNEHYL